MLTPPMLSELDPLQKGEGSIDPLGLAATYERLANLMLENVTVRMSRIRFVTALAVGTAVCEAWDGDERAADGVSSPWQVFEWATVIAFVKAREESGESIQQVAGSQKVTRALRSQFAVSRHTYLKTPTVFGFGGIFRRFAVGTRVIGSDMRLEEVGYALVTAWAADNGVDGFAGGTADSAGRRFRDRLRKVVQRGLDQGFLKSSDVPTDLAKELADRLDPSGLRPGRERDALQSLVRSQAGQREGSEFLTRELRQLGHVVRPEEEAHFLRSICPRAPSMLRQTLEEIDAYEALCRPLTDTFDWIRHWCSLRRGSPYSRSDFAAERHATELLASVQAGLHRIAAVDRLRTADPEVQRLTEQFESVASSSALFESVVDFHKAVQADKLPNGKRPWIESPKDDRSVVVRPAYALDAPPAPSSPYVHEYRIPTLSRFLADLGEIT